MTSKWLVDVHDYTQWFNFWHNYQLMSTYIMLMNIYMCVSAKDNHIWRPNMIYMVDDTHDYMYIYIYSWQDLS